MWAKVFKKCGTDDVLGMDMDVGVSMDVGMGLGSTIRSEQPQWSLRDPAAGGFPVCWELLLGLEMSGTRGASPKRPSLRGPPWI